VLDEAEGLFGPSRVLVGQRQLCLEALGRVGEAAALRAQAEALAPRSAWEHSALGRSLLHKGEVSAAVREFRRAMELRPQDFWPQFYEGVCAYRLGDHATAAAAFRTCVALVPDRAECFCNRGLALAALGPHGRGAGGLHAGAGAGPEVGGGGAQPRHPAPAREALPGSGSPTWSGRGRWAPALRVVSYHLALVHLGRQDRTAARLHLQRVLQVEPGHAEAQALLAQLKAKP